VVDTKGIESYCFVAGTKIITNFGNKNIEKVEIGDKVLTRNGFKKVVKTVDREAEVVDRGILCGTPDHPIFTDKGLHSLLSIPLCAKIYVCQPKQSYIKILNLVDTLTQKVIQTGTTLDLRQSGEIKALKGYIKKFIKIILAQFQEVLLFTTKTMIRPIIHQIIWNYYLKNNTTNTISQSFTQTHYGQKEDLLKRGKNYLMDKINGKKLPELKSFLLNILKKLFILKSQEILFVNGAVKNAEPIIKEEENIVARNVEKSGITDIIGKKQKVYNLTIEDTPEYFANGVLVHNCWDSTTGVQHFALATLYWYLALLSKGSGAVLESAGGQQVRAVVEVRGQDGHFEQQFNLKALLEERERDNNE
jgi:hypothetical protein